MNNLEEKRFQSICLQLHNQGLTNYLLTKNLQNRGEALMSYKSAILTHAPPYWEKMEGDLKVVIELVPELDEFKQIAFEVQTAFQGLIPDEVLWPIKRIQRIQNISDLGQLLLREQLLLAAHNNTQYYRVRRFLTINKLFLDAALEYNLDHRRCGLARLAFYNKIPQAIVGPDDVVVVVQVVTSDPNAFEINPSNNLEYFIDYIVYI